MRTTKESGHIEDFIPPIILISMLVAGVMLIKISNESIDNEAKKAKANQDTANTQQVSEYPEGIHSLLLPSDTKLVSIDCSEGELHVLLKPRTLAEPPTTYDYIGYRTDSTSNKIAKYTIIEN